MLNKSFDIFVSLSLSSSAWAFILIKTQIFVIENKREKGSNKNKKSLKLNRY